ncbi:unnamed protein product [Gadus morhua 'NCC']
MNDAGQTLAMTCSGRSHLTIDTAKAPSGGDIMPSPDTAALEAQRAEGAKGRISAVPLNANGRHLCTRPIRPRRRSGDDRRTRRMDVRIRIPGRHAQHSSKGVGCEEAGRQRGVAGPPWASGAAARSRWTPLGQTGGTPSLTSGARVDIRVQHGRVSAGDSARHCTLKLKPSYS